MEPSKWVGKRVPGNAGSTFKVLGGSLRQNIKSERRMAGAEVSGGRNWLLSGEGPDFLKEWHKAHNITWPFLPSVLHPKVHI